MAAYDGGDMVRITGTFVASGGALVNPASVYLQVMNPLGTVATWGYISAGSGTGSITLVATGCFYIDQLASVGGDWNYRWAGVQANWAAGESTFTINRTVFIL